MLYNETHLKELQSSMQSIKGRVEIYKGSTLETTCTCSDVLKTFNIQREGENKFFGFGICQKLDLELIGQDTPLAITKEHEIKIAFGVADNFLYPYPTFHAQDIQKDSETDNIVLTAYDALYRAAEYTVADLGLTGGYTIGEFAVACASLLGVGITTNITDDILNTSYPEGANFEGTEDLRSALNAIAEATQTIYYINQDNQLTFKRLDRTGDSVFTIDRSIYTSLKNGSPCVLSRIAHATELGDNVISNPAIAFTTGEAIKINNIESIIQTRLRNKNLITYPYYNVDRTTNGVKYTVNSDGSITVNGTATANASFYLTRQLRLPAGTYTLSSVNLTRNNELRAAMYNADGSGVSYLSDQTFTITEEKLIDVYLVVLSGNTVSNVTYKPMLVEGAVISEYAQYLTDFSGVTVTANGASYTPTAEGIVNISAAPEVNITTNNTGVLIDVEYYIQGFTQYVRNNPFWDLREDIATLVNNAITTIGAFTIDPFECEWFGNYLLEIGDKIKLITRKGEVVNGYLLNDGITYNGGITEITTWAYEDNEAETATNPTTLGEALNQTFARVDKANKEITLQASRVSANSEAIASLQITTDGIKTNVNKVQTTADAAKSAADTASANVASLTTRVTTAETNISQKADSVTVEAIQNDVTTIDGKVVANETAISALQVNTESISASVTRVEETTNTKLNSLEGELVKVQNEVSLKMDTEKITAEITKIKEEGVERVETSTGFTFDEEGLTIEKTNSEMKTQITEDGMTVYRNDTEVLVADHEGVKAKDLSATTYLKIGGRSRFENYGNDRTGCFWIGG